MDNAVQKLSVIGLGYIGLPTAAVFASRGLEVVGVDVTAEIVDTINAGKVHIVEPDLDIVVRGVVSTGNLRATMEPEPADAFIIAVPTPFVDGKRPDLTYIEAAGRAIAPVLERGNLVILESTSPVGATEKLANWLKEERPDLSFPQDGVPIPDVSIAHCPERVLPGHVLHELVANDRIVGGMTPTCAERATALYGIFLRGECFVTDARTAEMAKLTENSFRDVNIAFANELSVICDNLDIDVWKLIRLANRHPRVSILQPGPGVGGHCIAVDPWFIVDSAGDDARLIRSAREINDGKPEWVIGKIDAAAERFKAPVIALLGLAFKADIDDLRQSPALQIAKRVIDGGAKTFVVEPNIAELPESLAGKTQLTDMRGCLAEADIVVILVDHKEFSGLEMSQLASKVVIDTRGVLFAG